MFLKLVITGIPTYCSCFEGNCSWSLLSPVSKRYLVFVWLNRMPDSIYRQILWCPVLFLGSWMQIFKISEYLKASRRLHCPGLSSSGWGMNWESNIDIETLPHVKELVGSCRVTRGTLSGALWWPRGVGGGAGREAKEGADMWTHIPCCTAETDATL